jgi:ClpP class serine protease
MGVTFRVLSSGERKVDGNPHVPLSDEAVAAAQARVDQLAGLFFDLVEELRGMSAEDVRGLDGGIAIGREAVAQRLADVEVTSLSQLIGMIPSQVKNMDEIKSALQAIIDNPDSSEEEKEKAKAALAALEGQPVETEPEPEANTEPEPKAEGEEEEETSLGARALAAVKELKAQMQASAEKSERDALLATRPDLPKELRATMAKAPISTVREMLASLPRLALDPAAAASVPFTVGDGQGAPAPKLAPQAKAQLDARMGLTRPTYGVVDLGSEQLFGAPIPAK